ncbi:TetR family transcriptional regulator C-terminal domain-containing protein [Amycolatopsis roodepoortensis]|uniref:TetR family transcriptional regulator C-terminal domain-containing protein n=1 Tax=Amycolatopsis roodepoortensis TaxID=700274 RepID=UPI00214B1252|nr:TetR family transcriptional regulator C-terminal domain-containing protein [Amycolatopsis roodepoortensis]UUV30466.1 TetR family transcriptional regulator C-terminal domain-containing protein [Amycolatopsis roodepoortensis]
MPKIVDPDARRLEIAEAAFRVIQRDGLAQASLRSVAEEAGLAIGSVRHYFRGHDELIVFAMRSLGDRLEARLLGHLPDLLDSATPRSRRQEITEELLGELLPLTEQTRAETDVWLAFSAAAKNRPDLAEEAVRMYEGVRALVRRVLDGANEAGGLLDGLDLAVETERLAALLDGLALSTGRTPPELMRTVLRRHLESLRCPE